MKGLIVRISFLLGALTLAISSTISAANSNLGTFSEQFKIRVVQAKCPGLPQPAPGSPDPYTIIIDAAATAGVAIFAYFIIRDIVTDRRRKARGEEGVEETSETGETAAGEPAETNGKVLDGEK
jgi:hypothetical protein